MIIGIDLGTTNSLVSCYQGDSCVLIPNSLGDTLTPSVVSVTNKGEILVGCAAKERLYTHPHLTASAFKRFIGTGKTYQLGKFKFNPVELSSLILKSLKADAEAFLHETITEAIISVPAYFNDKQRRATKQAGELAGLKVQRLISEPTAAALAYGLTEGNSELKFLVMDIGGGTFDISIVDLFENILEVKAVAGNNFLGGEDFDRLIAEYFIKEQNLRDLDAKSMSIIHQRAEACKRILTDNDEAEMIVTLKNKQYKTQITNELLEKIGQPIFEQLKNPILQAVRDSNVSLDELNHIILVGGTTKMPVVRSYTTKIFGRPPLNWLNPDEVVGIGAGVCAAMKERNQAVSENFMTDVCPYTLGTDIIRHDEFGRETHGNFLPIIERNTTIPASKVVRLYTAHDFQNKIDVGIYQGEHRLVENNLKLGDLNINVPSLPRGKAKIDVRYTYDINGLLEVEVTSLDTNETKREVIINSDITMSAEKIKESLNRLKHLKIHPRENDQNRYLLEKAERMYEQTLGDLRERIAVKTQHFEAILDRQNPSEIKQEVENFSKYLDSVENWEF